MKSFSEALFTFTKFLSTPFRKATCCFPLNEKSTRSSITLLKSARPFTFFICFSCSGEMINDFPDTGIAFKSESKSFENDKLNSLNPLKTESTMNNAIAPTIIPPEAIRVMILIALFLLLLKIYRLAMYSGKFIYAFLRFSRRSLFSIGFSLPARALSIFSI